MFGIKPGYIALTISFLVLLIGIITFRVGFVTFIDNHEFGYQFDTRTGVISAIVDDEGHYKTGYVITPPILVKVHTIDLRPMQVCINANSRVLNCKLVRFNPDGFQTFISWHGRGNYEYENINPGSTSLNQILMSYAYDGSKNLDEYPFLTVIKELKADNITPTVDVKSDTTKLK